MPGRLGYGSDRGTVALLWPASAEGATYRYVLDEGSGISSRDPVREVSEATAQDMPSLDAAVAVLPAGASRELRERTARLLLRLAEKEPGTSVHLVQDTAAWEGYESAGDVLERVREIRALDPKLRPHEGLQRMGALLAGALPGAIVAPLHDGSFLVVTGVDDVPEVFSRAAERRRMDEAGAAAFLQAGGRPVWLMLPKDTPPQAADAAHRLARALSAQSVPVSLMPDDGSYAKWNELAGEVHASLDPSDLEYWVERASWIREGMDERQVADILSPLSPGGGAGTGSSYVLVFGGHPDFLVRVSFIRSSGAVGGASIIHVHHGKETHVPARE